MLHLYLPQEYAEMLLQNTFLITKYVSRMAFNVN